MLEIFAPYKWAALAERWPDILAAFGTTVGISGLALVIAMALGIVFGVLSVSRIPALRAVTRVYVEVVQNVPLLLQVFVFYAIFPLAGFTLAAFWIGVIAIGIYHGGYISEVVRSGIGSIHRGQFEAAKSQGFGYWQAMFAIILPQALRIILPPLAVQAANLVKNTSVLALIAGGELMYFSNSFAGATSYYGPVYVVAALLYFAICFPLSRLALYLERRTRSRRHVTTGDATEELCDDAMEVTPGTHDITGRAAADALAGGVQTMFETVSIAPARQAPSPRHPLHALGEGEGWGESAGEGTGTGDRFTGRQAAEIADEIGREIAQEIAWECGVDEACAVRIRRTKPGRIRQRLRERGLAAAELSEDAFLGNLVVPGSPEVPAGRIAHVRAPHDEADYDEEAEDTVNREDNANTNSAASSTNSTDTSAISIEASASSATDSTAASATNSTDTSAINIEASASSATDGIDGTARSTEGARADSANDARSADGGGTVANTDCTRAAAAVAAAEEISTAEGALVAAEGAREARREAREADEQANVTGGPETESITASVDELAAMADKAKRIADEALENCRFDERKGR